MKLEYQDGCWVSTTIDNKELVECDIKTVREVCKKLVDLLPKNNCLFELQRFFIDCLINMGKETDLGYCEQCGNYNSRYELKIEDI